METKQYDSEFEIKTADKSISLSLKIGETVTSDMYKNISDLVTLINSLNNTVKTHDNILKHIENKVEKMKEKYKKKIKALESKNSIDEVTEKIRNNNQTIINLEEDKLTISQEISSLRDKQRHTLEGINTISFDSETPETVNGRINGISIMSELSNEEREMAKKLNHVKELIANSYENMGIEEEIELVKEIKQYNELKYKNIFLANKEQKNFVEIDRCCDTIYEEKDMFGSESSEKIEEYNEDNL